MCDSKGRCLLLNICGLAAASNVYVLICEASGFFFFFFFFASVIDWGERARTWEGPGESSALNGCNSLRRQAFFSRYPACTMR